MTSSSVTASLCLDDYLLAARREWTTLVQNTLSDMVGSHRRNFEKETAAPFARNGLELSQVLHVMTHVARLKENARSLQDTSEKSSRHHCFPSFLRNAILTELPQLAEVREPLREIIKMSVGVGVGGESVSTADDIFPAEPNAFSLAISEACSPDRGAADETDQMKRNRTARQALDRWREHTREVGSSTPTSREPSGAAAILRSVAFKGLSPSIRLEYYAALLDLFPDILSGERSAGVPSRILNEIKPDWGACVNFPTAINAIRRALITAHGSGIGDDERYFVVADEVLVLLSALVEDPCVALVDPTPSESRLKIPGLKGFPPMIFSALAKAIGPLLYISRVCAPAYLVARSMATQLWLPLQSPSVELVATAVAFEQLLDGDSRTVAAARHCSSVNIVPFSLVYPWVATGFACLFTPHQILRLWDCLLAVHCSTPLFPRGLSPAYLLLAFCAAAVFALRADVIPRLQNKEECLAAFADASAVEVMTLLREYMLL